MEEGSGNALRGVEVKGFAEILSSSFVESWDVLFIDGCRLACRDKVWSSSASSNCPSTILWLGFSKVFSRNDVDDNDDDMVIADTAHLRRAMVSTKEQNEGGKW